MCKIVEFVKLDIDFTKEPDKWFNMFLSITDDNKELQSMTKFKFGNSYTIVYNGVLSNKKPLRENLQRMDYLFKTDTDTEVILTGYMAFGKEFFIELKGSFTFTIWDDNIKTLFTCNYI